MPHSSVNLHFPNNMASISVAFEVSYMYLVYNPDGIVLVRRYYVTCLNLLLSNRRVQIYIHKRRSLDMRTDVRTDPPAGDVEHAGDVIVRRRWVQFVSRPVSMIRRHRERPAESRQLVPGC